YQLGYLLVNYGYLKYGDSFWKNVTRDATAFKGLFYPFQKAVKTYTGKSYKEFQKNALDYYKAQLHVVPTKSRSGTTVTNYYFPQFIGKDSLLYLKSAYNKIAAFYIKDGKEEHQLEKQSISSDEWFSYRNG